MRLAAPLLLVAVALAGCGNDDPNPSAPGEGALAALVVTVDEDGKGGAPARELRLNCAEPTDSPACGAAAGISARDLAPTPPDTACTQLFGGPETATIKGQIRGEDVDATFSRSDGCEIERWKRVQPLLDEVQ
ncbi:MAG TPA: hypothetical protein VFZ00_15950 [Solirubrobacter sp.]|nr:hypothetical protein [Solirubrobacter sp.]